MPCTSTLAVLGEIILLTVSAGSVTAESLYALGETFSFSSQNQSIGRTDLIACLDDSMKYTWKAVSTVASPRADSLGASSY